MLHRTWCRLLKSTSMQRVRLYTCQAINFLPPRLSLESIQLSDSDCQYVVSLHPDPGRSVGDINNQLVEFCKAQPVDKSYGFGILDPYNMEESISLIDKHSNTKYLKGLAVGCEMIANQEPDYKKCYYLFQLCASANIPVALLCNDTNVSIMNVSTVARALAQIITDGIFDYYPGLQILVHHDKAIPLVIDALAGNHPGNSLQKQISSYYLQNNVFCVSSCSDLQYLKFLEISLSQDRILFGNEVGKQIVFPSVADLTLQKIMNRNARCLLGVDDSDETCKRWIYDENNVSILQSSAIKFLSSKVRDRSTNCKDFMTYSDRLMTILAEETLARMKSVIPSNIITPTGVFRGVTDTENRHLCAVSIMRSGDILLEAFRRLVPGLHVGKILVQRDESSVDKKPVFYYKKLPNAIANCSVLLVDPMLATAGSALCALDCLVQQHYVPSENITFVNLFACEEGLAKLQQQYPLVHVVTLYVDECLNEEKYIVPGVGDFGDRYYGTVD